MLNAEKIEDPEKLRRIAGLLDREVFRLQQQVRDLAFENARLRGETLAQVDFSYPLLEKALAEQDSAAEASPPRVRPAQRGHGPRPQEHLPVLEQVLELPQDERDCKACNGQLETMAGQYEDSERSPSAATPCWCIAGRNTAAAATAMWRRLPGR